MLLLFIVGWIQERFFARVHIHLLRRFCNVIRLVHVKFIYTWVFKLCGRLTFDMDDGSIHTRDFKRLFWIYWACYISPTHFYLSAWWIRTDHSRYYWCWHFCRLFPFLNFVWLYLILLAFSFFIWLILLLKLACASQYMDTWYVNWCLRYIRCWLPILCTLQVLVLCIIKFIFIIFICVILQYFFQALFRKILA